MEFDIEILQALDQFYRGEKLGVWEGDFIKNERKRGLKLPKILKRFLTDYGFLGVNCGRSQLWLPDKIDQDTAKVDGEMRKVLILGMLGDDLIAVLEDDIDQDDPMVLTDDLPEENGEEITLVFHKSNFKLSELILQIFLESPPVYSNAIAYHDDGIAELLQKLDEKTRIEIEKRMRESEQPARFLAWNAEEKQFIAGILLPEREILLEFEPGLAISELENIFTREFYENSENCDFEHALKVLLPLINYWEQNDQIGMTLAERYKLAGRCCWVLKRWGDAEKYYIQAKQLYDKILAKCLDDTASFYEGMGNFYLAREDVFKSSDAYRRVNEICDFAGNNGPRRKGNRMVRQGMMMVEAARYEKAIELYNQALEEYQKDPKDCKYDIARCQQLRGEAKKYLRNQTK